MNTNEFIKLELLKRRHGLLNEQKLIYDIQGYSLKCDYNIRKLLQNNYFTFDIKIFDHVSKFWKEHNFMKASEKNLAISKI